METKVLRVERLSPEELEREFLSQERPVVLTRAIEDWPAVRWTFDQLKQACGQHELRVRGGDRQTWRLLCRVKAGEYFDFLTGGASGGELARHAPKRPYAAFNNLRPLEQDVAFESLLPPGYQLTSTMVWIGPAGSLTPLHYDASGTTVFVQLLGRKRFHLFPFDQSRYLYPSDIFDYGSVFSSVNLDAPDLSTHPEYARAAPLEVEVGPGEVLLIPNKMWHQVQALDTSISVTRRVRRPQGTTWEDLGWYTKALLHLLGWYKPTRCLCHIDELTPRDVALYSPAIRFLVRVGGLRAHGRDLAELIGWAPGGRG